MYVLYWRTKHHDNINCKDRIEINYHVQVFFGGFSSVNHVVGFSRAKRFGPKRPFFSCKKGTKTECENSTT